MSNKSYNLIKIVILSVIALALIFILVILLGGKLKNKFFFEMNDNTKLVYSKEYDVNSFNKFNFDLSSADLDVIYSENNNIKLELYEREENNVSVNEDGNTLEVNFSKNRSICFGICYSSKRAKLYLPKDFKGNLDVNSSSGDISMDDYSNISGNIKSTSGNIDIRGIEMATVRSTSGDINVNNANSLDVSSTSGELILGSIPTLKFETTSGDVSVREVNEITGRTTSGEVEINNVNGRIDINTTSGDVEIKYALLNKNSNISTVSGEVDIRLNEAVNVDVNTVSGDKDIYNIDRNSDIKLKINTTSGDIEVN